MHKQSVAIFTGMDDYAWKYAEKNSTQKQLQNYPRLWIVKLLMTFQCPKYSRKNLTLP